jgi:colanic acid biosynthesis glycosyl transferase WcaI
MRFIFLTQYYPPEIGAPQTRLMSVVRLLRAKGHDVEVVTAMPNHLMGKTFDRYRRKLFLQEQWDGAPVFRSWMYTATGMGARRLLSYLSFTLTCVVGLVRARKADYLFIESPPLFLAVPGILVARIRGMRSIFNVADLWPDSVRALGGAFGQSRLLALADVLERWTYASADVVCAVSHGIVRTLCTTKNVAPRKVVFFPNGVDTELFAPRAPDDELQTRFGGPAARVFIYAGTHGSAQGLEHVIDAAALVRDTPAFFLFVGDGHAKQSLRERARELQLGNVAFVDSVPLDQMPRYFSIAYASIVPLLRRDAFKDARPSKMFPALASGVPVIFSGEGESAALLEASDAGVVAEPESAADMARTIRVLLGDPARRDQIGAHGRALALQSYGWSNIVDIWLATLTERFAR